MPSCRVDARATVLAALAAGLGLGAALGELHLGEELAAALCAFAGALVLLGGIGWAAAARRARRLHAEAEETHRLADRVLETAAHRERVGLALFHRVVAMFERL